jgi:hypothetical protein
MTSARQAIEFHDSDLLAIERDSQGNGILILDAYVHRQSRGEGGMQKIRIVIDSMQLVGDTGPLPAGIYDGSLTVDGSALEDLLPFPCEHQGDLNLTLSFLYDARTISISGDRLSVGPDGDFRFVEPLNMS